LPENKSSLQVRDIVEAAPSVRETTVRSIGPAAVFVVEQDARVRMVVSALSRSERASLLAWLRTNLDARPFAVAYSDARTNFSGTDEALDQVLREVDYEQLLERGEPLRIGRGVS
jgi:hypothetical protein